MTVQVIIPDWPTPPAVRALSTTRAGGVSKAPFDSLNLSLGVGDTPQAVSRNRELLIGALALPSTPRWLRQVHGTRVIDAEGAGHTAQADGCVAITPGLVCVVLSADCIPILLCDVAGERIAAVHAGWRGLAAGVVESAVHALDRPAAELLAWLGPGIGRTAYEVGDEVHRAFLNRDPDDDDAFVPSSSGRWLANLADLARRRLSRCGVCAVHSASECTYSDPQRFFSHRRDGPTGRMATLIWRER